jgi:hypothetical protein
MRPLMIGYSRVFRAAELKLALVDAAEMREGGYSAGGVRLRQVQIVLHGVGSNANSIQTLRA